MGIFLFYNMEERPRETVWTKHSAREETRGGSHSHRGYNKSYLSKPWFLFSHHCHFCHSASFRVLTQFLMEKGN